MYKITTQTFINEELHDEEITFVETIEEGYEQHVKWSEQPEIATGVEYLPLVMGDTFIMCAIKNRGLYATFVCEPDVYNEHIMFMEM